VPHIKFANSSHAKLSKVARICPLIDPPHIDDDRDLPYSEAYAGRDERGDGRMEDDGGRSLEGQDQPVAEPGDPAGGQSINVFSNGDQIFLHGNLNSGINEDRADRDAIAVRRQSFLFDFYRQAFLQDGTTFRFSLIFMSLGAVIVLGGGVMAVMHLGGFERSGPGLITALSGAIIGSCGGAFALHANRARRHLTQQAEKMESDLRDDRKLEQTLRLIDEVTDAELRNRLKSLIALRLLDLHRDPGSIVNHLLDLQNQATADLPREAGPS
jgi:hypothetical protein